MIRSKIQNASFIRYCNRKIRMTKNRAILRDICIIYWYQKLSRMVVLHRIKCFIKLQVVFRAKYMSTFKTAYCNSSHCTPRLLYNRLGSCHLQILSCTLHAYVTFYSLSNRYEHLPCHQIPGHIWAHHSSFPFIPACSISNPKHALAFQP